METCREFDYLTALGPRIKPLLIATQLRENDQVVFLCKDDLQQPVLCGVCGMESPRFGHLRIRSVRDLDCGDRMVFLKFPFPRVRCKVHGVVMAKQTLFEPGSSFTIAFEDFALSLISDEVTVTEIASQLRVSRNVLGRILNRAYRRRRKERSHPYQ